MARQKVHLPQIRFQSIGKTCVRNSAGSNVVLTFEKRILLTIKGRDFSFRKQT